MSDGVGGAESSSTSLPNYQIHLRGFAGEAVAKELGQLVSAVVSELSTAFNLAQLDGITIAVDYEEALWQLDRGYVASSPLAPSRSEAAVGVAMAARVKRGGVVKSHIVIDAALVMPLLDPANDYTDFRQAIHLIAHECAHVEITATFDAAFPGHLLQRDFEEHAARRWGIILTCWEEYKATQMSARIGADPTENYVETFLLTLKLAPTDANEAVDAYHLAQDGPALMKRLYDAIGTLLAHSAYLLGNMSGHDLPMSAMPVVKEALAHHWFEKSFWELADLLGSIDDGYGVWENQDQFEAIGDLADNLATHFGVEVDPYGDGNVYVT